MGISSLSPFGPIFAKEMRVTARRKRTYLLRTIYLGLLLLFLLMAYSVSRPWNNQGNVWRSQQQSELGRIFFMCFSMFCVFAMALIGPVLTCTAISSERLHKTLPVLLMTPISAWQIVSGKLFSRMLVVITLIGLSLPVLALVRLLGGVELYQMFGVILVSFVTALFSATLGLMLSTIMNRAYAVILLSYAGMLVLYLFFPFVMVLNVRGGSMAYLTWMTATNPFVCVGMLASGESRIMSYASWTTCLGIHLAMATVLLVFSSRLLRKLARKLAEGGGVSARPGDMPDEIVVSADVALSSRAKSPQKTRKPSDVSDNPVLWRELRRPLMARRWQAVIGSLACLAILVISYISLGTHDLKSPATQIGYAFIFNFLGWLLASVLSATSIAGEVESDTWTLLLASPLTARKIVYGKVLGLTRRLLWPSVLMVGHFLVFTIAGVINWETLFVVLWVIVSFNTIWIATGTYLSLRCKKVTLAVVLNLLLAIGLYAVTPMVLLTLQALFIPEYRATWAEHTLWYIPYYHLGTAIEAARRWPETLRLPDRTQVNLNTYLLIVSTIGMAHLGISMLILWYTQRRFNRIVGRAAGLKKPENRAGVQ